MVGLRNFVVELLQLRGRAVLKPWIFSLCGKALEPAEQEWHGAAAMREDEADVGKLPGGSAIQEAGDRPRRVRGVFDGGHGNAGNKSGATSRLRGMNVNNGPPSIQFLIYGCESRIAKVLIVKTRHQSDTVRLQCIQCVLDFAQTAWCIGKRNGGKETEAAGMILHHLCSVLIAIASELAGILDAAQPYARLYERRDGSCNPILVHFRERHFGRPWRRAAAFPLRQDRFQMPWRYEVMVEVHSARRAAGCSRALRNRGQRPAHCRSHGKAQCASHETSPVQFV